MKGAPAAWQYKGGVPGLMSYVICIVCFVLVFAKPAVALVHWFTLDQPGARNLGILRLTNDVAVRDEGNYHNIQCWSYNGRYTCYTHWTGGNGGHGKRVAEVYVFDLLTGEARRVDTGINPRWANNHNWLFYCHWTGDGSKSYETGTQIIRYDVDTGEKVVITHGMEIPGSLDTTDTWLYGVLRYRGQKPELRAARVRNQEKSEVELLQGVPNRHPYIHVNPFYPVVMVRAKEPKKGMYGKSRVFFDLDGSNLRTGSVMCQGGHQSWSGDGRYLLIGNRQVSGRPWDKPYPSDLEILSWARVGDISPCGKSGRYICGGNLIFVDTRSGDSWPLLYPYSRILYPIGGDRSTLVDIDPKGSPDGTKVHYHSNRDLENMVSARIKGHMGNKRNSISVDSTAGFPENGDLVCGREVIGYEKKSRTTFEGLTRQKYGTLKVENLFSKARLVFPLSEFVLTEREKVRAEPDAFMVAENIGTENPLLYQRQTDCYVVVARLPDPPYLRLRENRVELVPGENHREIRGYRILKNGHQLSTGLIAPGASFTLPGPGVYRAIATEWSGLESPSSIPLELDREVAGKVLLNCPGDFSWTSSVWMVDGRSVTEEQGLAAVQAERKIIHKYEGVIAIELWESGEKVRREDLSGTGMPIRRQEFFKGILKKRTYTTGEGYLASEELFGSDGSKQEYIRYDTRKGRLNRERAHWWYDRGRPVKMTRRKKVVFEIGG